MKTKTPAEPLYLNLYNFESTSAQESPYVLTSPRSLEACRKAGLKPVELLYKSLQDYQEDLGGINAEKVLGLYTLQEQDRISKLDKCRSIRKDLLSSTDASSVLKENGQPSPLESCVKSDEPSSRKTLLDKENASRAKGYCSDSVIKERSTSRVDAVRDSYEKRARNLNSVVRGSLTPVQLTLSKPTSTNSSKCTLRDLVNTKKSYRKSKVFPAGPVFASPLSSSPDNSTSSSTSTVRFPNSRCSSAAKLKDKPPGGSRTDSGKSKTQQYPRYRPCKLIQQSVSKDASHKWSVRDGLQSANGDCDNNNNTHNSSISSITASTSTLQRKKHVSFRYLKCADDLALSEHDRRILESMALKKELERENEEFAYQAHRLWEQDREQRLQLSSTQEAEWREYVAEKRRLENERNTRKWEEMKTSLRKSQWLLEQSLRKKDERSTNLKKKAEEKKLCELEDRNLLAARRRAVVEASQHQIELDAMLWQYSLDKLQKEKLEKAESVRSKQRESNRRRVASANRVEELRHQDRWQQVREETEGALRDLQEFCRVRENKAQKKYGEILSARDAHLKEQSLERELKLQQARRLQDELDQGLEKWQDQVLTLQWASTQRADLNVTRQREVKRQRVEADNRARETHHHKLMERICREDEARIQYVRQLISRKEEKMRRMAQSRETALQESRIQAQTTADLREHIRRTLSPETFDRKVARVALEMRVASRPPTASPTMNRSHIFLG